MSTLKEIAFSKEELLKCEGFQPKFIDGKTNVSLVKILDKAKKSALPKVEGNASGTLNYNNLSVMYDSSRKIPFFAAYNIDGGSKVDKISRVNEFKADPRISPEIQLNNAFYQYNYTDPKTGTPRKVFEVGHVAAHNEMAWGNDAQLQAFRTFHFPNSFPQAEMLNSGIWRSLESYIVEETSEIDKNKKICVFTGPFILNSDPIYKNVKKFKIPVLFFKVVVFSTEKGIYSTAFVMSHSKRIKEIGIVEDTFARPLETDEIAEFSDFKYKKVFQVSMDFLEKNTGLNFTWKNVKKVPIKDDLNKLTIIKDVKNSDEAGAFRGAEKMGVPKMKINIILP